ncbi:hypothetical protein LWI29_015739 [Acer saccharum]|uniref:Uncharacterized protein n=1 Tax=Acer saccharum TaxID=4024 RepID=A0AA39SVG2_ACESA|nr:hypothetical protein LWI29_015739 [Acer saccharum]
MNGHTKAPILNYAAETSQGTFSIRAFNTMDMFFENYLKNRCCRKNQTVYAFTTRSSCNHRGYETTDSWPCGGRIELHDLKIRYCRNAPLVLKGITCTFKEGTRVGVVGRTEVGRLH